MSNLAWVGLGERMVQWFSLEAEPSVWISLVLSMLVLAVVMRKGLITSFHLSTAGSEAPPGPAGACACRGDSKNLGDGR